MHICYKSKKYFIEKKQTSVNISFIANRNCNIIILFKRISSAIHYLRCKYLQRNAITIEQASIGMHVS